MIRRTCVLFISLLLIIYSLQAEDADTTKVSRTVIIGAELTGPVIFSIDDNVLNAEAYLAYRINDKYYAVVEPGFGKFSFSQYNYNYTSEGYFLRIGADLNLIKPKNGPVNHFAGFSLRYGLSLATQETPWFVVENYWGRTESYIKPEFYHSHFLEVGGGVKAEVFRNIYIGWSVKIRMLIYSSADKNSKPAYIPGIGTTGGILRPGFSYWLAWRLPFRFEAGRK